MGREKTTANAGDPREPTTPPTPHGIRRSLSGGNPPAGVHFEAHEMPLGADLRWDIEGARKGIGLCLNLEGNGELRAGVSCLRVRPWTAVFYRQGDPGMTATRSPSEVHRFIVVEWSAAFLERHLGAVAGDLHPLVQSTLLGDTRSGIGPAASLNLRQRALIAGLDRPPVLAAAQGLWFLAKAVELAGEFLFAGPAGGELFCRRQQQVARDRVERAAECLRAKLADPPSLEELGKMAGCSPFYLSRTFSREMGMTVPQYLRQLRLESAAELLRNGSHNVTEAAMAVGYNSLSHFSQAFHHHYGCCPGLFPMATATQRAAEAGPGVAKDSRSQTTRPRG